MKHYTLCPAITSDCTAAVEVMMVIYIRISEGKLPTLFIGNQKACYLAGITFGPWLNCKEVDITQSLLIGPGVLVYNPGA